MKAWAILSHPGKRMVWGGYGFRSEKSVYDEIARIIDAPVLLWNSSSKNTIT
ncbi:MAG: hypothetical protein R2794_02980 [Chitinophagales bacterium]